MCDTVHKRIVHGNTICGWFDMEKVSPFFANPRVQIQQLCVVSLHTRTQHTFPAFTFHQYVKAGKNAVSFTIQPKCTIRCGRILCTAYAYVCVCAFQRTFVCVRYLRTCAIGWSQPSRPCCRRRPTTSTCTFPRVQGAHNVCYIEHVRQRLHPHRW